MSPSAFPALLADVNPDSFWFPPKASTFADETDPLFMYILYISIVFFVLIVAAMIYFVVKFRRRPGYKGDSSALHNNTLEITWTVIPTLIVIWIFAEGTRGYINMMTAPGETIDINVTARKWDWSFQYPNGAISDQLHIPNNQAIRLRMRSEDVLHAFYVPAFRAKSDVVPGRVTTMWFQPTLEGEYDLFCAEYCGDQHSEMIKRHGVVVHDQEGYDAWLAEAVKPPTHPVAHGYWLYSKMGCKSCHSVQDGVKVVGPWFANTYGKTFKNSEGKDVTFDAQYVRESILNPQAQYREGYQTASQMPSFQGKLDETQIAALTSFLEYTTNADFLAAIADGDLTDDEKATLGIADAEEDDENSGDEAAPGEQDAETTPSDAEEEDQADDQ
ncbi:MAG: cytochrome c oxidase subunit II [Aureliella sp.]